MRKAGRRARDVRRDVGEEDRRAVRASRAAAFNDIKLGREIGWFVGWRDVAGDLCGGEDFVCFGVCVVREWAGFARAALALGLVIRTGLHASVADRIACGDEISTAGVGGGTGIRHEPARSIARGTERVRLHGAEHCVRIDGGPAGRADAGGE